MKMPAARALLFVLIAGLLTLVFLRPGLRSRLPERGGVSKGASGSGQNAGSTEEQGGFRLGHWMTSNMGSGVGSSQSGIGDGPISFGAITLPGAAESEMTKNRFLAAIGLSARFPSNFRYSMDTDLDGKLHLLHGFDPKTGSRIVAYGLNGTATDAQILDYVMETSGLSAVAMDEVEEKGTLPFGPSSGLNTGRVFLGVDPVLGREIKAVLVTSAAGDRTYLLGLVARPTYFIGHEDQIDELLNGLTVQR